MAKYRRPEKSGIFFENHRALIHMALDLHVNYVSCASFQLFIKLYFVYDVRWSYDQFLIFVNVTRDMILSTMAIVTVAVVR